MIAPGHDIRVVACNVSFGTKVFPAGARAYVVMTNPGNGNDRVVILGRSRGGRWVKKWERRDRLSNFRTKTIPPEHPLYTRLGDGDGLASPRDFFA